MSLPLHAGLRFMRRAEGLPRGPCDRFGRGTLSAVATAAGFGWKPSSHMPSKAAAEALS